MARAPEGRTADGEAPKRPWWTADRNPKAATCSREQAPSSLDMSALRSHVVERRVRLLHRAPNHSRAWAGIEARPWPERGAASDITVGDVRLAKTPCRWARCPATDFEQVPGAARRLGDASEAASSTAKKGQFQ